MKTNEMHASYHWPACFTLAEATWGLDAGNCLVRTGMLMAQDPVRESTS